MKFCCTRNNSNACDSRGGRRTPSRPATEHGTTPDNTTHETRDKNGKLTTFDNSPPVGKHAHGYSEDPTWEERSNAAPEEEGKRHRRRRSTSTHASSYSRKAANSRASKVTANDRHFKRKPISSLLPRQHVGEGFDSTSASDSFDSEEEGDDARDYSLRGQRSKRRTKDRRLSSRSSKHVPAPPFAMQDVPSSMYRDSGYESDEESSPADLNKKQAKQTSHTWPLISASNKFNSSYKDASSSDYTTTATPTGLATSEVEIEPSNVNMPSPAASPSSHANKASRFRFRKVAGRVMTPGVINNNDELSLPPSGEDVENSSQRSQETDIPEKKTPFKPTKLMLDIDSDSDSDFKLGSNMFKYRDADDENLQAALGFVARMEESTAPEKNTKEPDTFQQTGHQKNGIFGQGVNMREVSDKLRNFSRLSTASEDEALEGFDPEEVKRSLSARYPLSSGKSRTVSSGTSGGYGPSSASASASFRVTYSNPVMVGIPSPYTVTAPEVKPPPPQTLVSPLGIAYPMEVPAKAVPITDNKLIGFSRSYEGMPRPNELGTSVVPAQTGEAWSAGLEEVPKQAPPHFVPSSMATISTVSKPVGYNSARSNDTFPGLSSGSTVTASMLYDQRVAEILDSTSLLERQYEPSVQIPAVTSYPATSSTRYTSDRKISKSDEYHPVAEKYRAQFPDESPKEYMFYLLDKLGIDLKHPPPAGSSKAVKLGKLMEKEHQVLAEVIADVIGSVGGYKSNNGKRVRQLLCESLGGDWQSSSKKNKKEKSSATVSSKNLANSIGLERTASERKIQEKEDKRRALQEKIAKKSAAKVAKAMKKAEKESKKRMPDHEGRVTSYDSWATTESDSAIDDSGSEIEDNGLRGTLKRTLSRFTSRGNQTAQLGPLTSQPLTVPFNTASIKQDNWDTDTICSKSPGPLNPVLPSLRHDSEVTLVGVCSKGSGCAKSAYNTAGLDTAGNAKEGYIAPPPTTASEGIQDYGYVTEIDVKSPSRATSTTAIRKGWLRTKKSFTDIRSKYIDIPLAPEVNDSPVKEGTSKKKSVIQVETEKYNDTVVTTQEISLNDEDDDKQSQGSENSVVASKNNYGQDEDYEKGCKSSVSTAPQHTNFYSTSKTSSSSFPLGRISMSFDTDSSPKSNNSKTSDVSGALTETTSYIAPTVPTAPISGALDAILGIGSGISSRPSGPPLVLDEALREFIKVSPKVDTENELNNSDNAQELELGHWSKQDVDDDTQVMRLKSKSFEGSVENVSLQTGSSTNTDSFKMMHNIDEDDMHLAIRQLEKSRKKKKSPANDLSEVNDGSGIAKPVAKSVGYLGRSLSIKANKLFSRSATLRERKADTMSKKSNSTTDDDEDPDLKIKNTKTKTRDYKNSIGRSGSLSAMKSKLKSRSRSIRLKKDGNRQRKSLEESDYESCDDQDIEKKRSKSAIEAKLEHREKALDSHSRSESPKKKHSKPRRSQRHDQHEHHSKSRSTSNRYYHEELGKETSKVSGHTRHKASCDVSNALERQFGIDIQELEHSHRSFRRYKTMDEELRRVNEEFDIATKALINSSATASRAATINKQMSRQSSNNNSRASSIKSFRLGSSSNSHSKKEVKGSTRGARKNKAHDKSKHLEVGVSVPTSLLGIVEPMKNKRSKTKSGLLREYDEGINHIRVGNTKVSVPKEHHDAAAAIANSMVASIPSLSSENVESFKKHTCEEKNNTRRTRKPRRHGLKDGKYGSSIASSIQVSRQGTVLETDTSKHKGLKVKHRTAR